MDLGTIVYTASRQKDTYFHNIMLMFVSVKIKIMRF